MLKFYAILLTLCPVFMVQFINSSASSSNLKTDKSINIELNKKVVEGTVYVPAKEVFESLGWEVAWVSKDKMLIAVKGNKKKYPEN